MYKKQVYSFMKYGKICTIASVSLYHCSFLTKKNDKNEKILFDFKIGRFVTLHLDPVGITKEDEL